MRDLDIRGSGNLLGAEQSGFIAEIGFEMYHKILDEAIQELKDDEFTDLFADEKERKYVSFTQIDTDLEVLIPDEYVTNISERYNLYTELSKLENEEQLTAFARSMEDRFGPIPREVFELFNTLRLQWYGKQIGLEKFHTRKTHLKVFSLTIRNHLILNPISLEKYWLLSKLTLQSVISKKSKDSSVLLLKTFTVLVQHSTFYGI